MRAALYRSTEATVRTTVGAGDVARATSRVGASESLKKTAVARLSRAVTTSTGDTFYLGGVPKADRNAGRLWMQRFEEQGIEDLRDVSDEYWSAMAGSLQ